MDAELPPLEGVVFLDIETTGLNPYRDKVVTVQVRRGGVTTVWREWELGEPGVIEGFFGFTDSVFRKRTHFVGYNLIKFDLPFLTRRAEANGLLGEERWRILNSYLHVVDLYQLLGDHYVSAKLFYAKLAGRTQTTRNEDIPTLYHQGSYQKIEEYIENEMQSMELLYQALLKQDFYQRLVQLRKNIINR